MNLRTDQQKLSITNTKEEENFQDIVINQELNTEPEDQNIAIVSSYFHQLRSIVTENRELENTEPLLLGNMYMCIAHSYHTLPLTSCMFTHHTLTLHTHIYRTLAPYILHTHYLSHTPYTSHTHTAHVPHVNTRTIAHTCQTIHSHTTYTHTIPLSHTHHR